MGATTVTMRAVPQFVGRKQSRKLKMIQGASKKKAKTTRQEREGEKSVVAANERTECVGDDH